MRDDIASSNIIGKYISWRTAFIFINILSEVRIMGIYPNFCTTLIGSMPRSPELLELKRQAAYDKDKKEAYIERLLKETKKVVELQKNAGIDIPVCGELGRDNFVSFVAEQVEGISLMSMDEILEITANSDDFKESLNQMDASDNSMSNPICTGKIDTSARLVEDEVKIMKELISDNMYKVTIPSPYILTRSMWLKEVTQSAYKDRKELGEDVVKLILNEVEHLIAEGVKVIQIDEPIVSEVVFQRSGGDNSFY